MKNKISAVAIFLMCGLVCARPALDARDKTVNVPDKIVKIVTINDGLVECVMKALNIKADIVASGTECSFKEFDYSFEGVDGGKECYRNGQNPAGFFFPYLKDRPIIAGKDGSINYEKILSLEPDVVIVREGACAVGRDKEKTRRSYEMLEKLGIPVVVTRGPNASGGDIKAISREIEIIGAVFGQKKQAAKLAKYLENIGNMVKERTKNIADKDKPSVLILGLSSTARNKGGAGHGWGRNTIENYFVENVVNAKNAFASAQNQQIIGAEHILGANPDAIVLATANGYHPPYEMYYSEHYQSLRSIKAVQNKRISVLPWTPCNCEKRLEYPIDIMVIAKAAYPEKFKDINLSRWVLGFYKSVYKVDGKTAKDLRSIQWLN